LKNQIESKSSCSLSAVMKLSAIEGWLELCIFGGDHISEKSFNS